MKKLSGSQLKWLALVTMVLDHFGMMFCKRSLYPVEYEILRGIGRISFPIFCFLLVEGFCHTHSFRKYACSLAVFAVLSEIPYNLAVNRSLLDPQRQNIFFTLLAGLFLMKCLEQRSRFADRMLILFMAGVLAEMVGLDYGMFGLMQIAGLYLCREHHAVRNVVLALLHLSQGGLQMWGAAAVLPIECYDGTRGRQWKYFFYVVYPVHLLLFVYLRWKLVA